MKIQHIYATNKQVPTLVRDLIENEKLDPILKRESVSLFESKCIRYVRITKKGKVVHFSSLYEEHSHLDFSRFKNIVESKPRDMNPKEESRFMKFLKGIKAY
jgi:hypothetical protein